MLINKSRENDDIMKFQQSYYVFKRTYFDSPSVYFGMINETNIDTIVIQTYKT